MPPTHGRSLVREARFPIIGGSFPVRQDRPTIRSAASLPETSTVGTPTPGVVEEPASTTLARPATMFFLRNGPVCRKTCEDENGLPSTIPRSAQVCGVSDRKSVV